MSIPGSVHVLAAAALLVGCFDTAADLDPTGPCARPDIAIGDWELVDRASFNFRIPPQFIDLGLQPIDSDVMVFEFGDGAASLSFDFGIYSSELDEFDCSVEINGTNARLAVVETSDRIVVTARWRDLGPPSELSGAGPALVMRGEAREPRFVELLLAAMHSVVIE